MLNVNATGYHFDLTVEQAEAIAPLFAQVEAANLRGEYRGMVVAQIWQMADGRTTAVVGFIPEAKAVLMAAALRADSGVIVQVDRPATEDAP